MRISHIMPGPLENVLLSGAPAAEDCDATPLPSVRGPIVIRSVVLWAARGDGIYWGYVGEVLSGGATTG